MSDPTPSVERRIEQLLERMHDRLLRIDDSLTMIASRLESIESVALAAQRSEGWPSLPRAPRRRPSADY